MADRIRWKKWAPQYIANYMEDFKLPKEFACAFPGNFARECGYFNSLQEVNPIVKGSAGGFGHAQWTGPRRRAFEKWLKRKGYFKNGTYLADNFEMNYAYSWRELTGNEPGLDYRHVITRLKTATSLENAVWIVGKYYEGPLHLNLDDRIISAREALALYNANPVPALMPDVKEEKMPDDKIIVTPADPAMPVTKSIVMQGAVGGIVVALYAIVQTYDPAISFKEQPLTFWTAVGGLLTAIWTAYGRISSPAQPLTWTQKEADKVASERTVAEAPAAVVQSPVPIAQPLEAKPLNELAQELPQALNLIIGLAGAVVPQIGMLKNVLDAVQKQRPLELPHVGREGEKL